jgi:HD-GYP domain-containing protein (c-di-GMP phosphodiesterase class II)
MEVRLLNHLKILKKDESLVKVFSNVGDYSLKAKDDNLEVIYYEGKATKSIMLHPDECEGAIYMIYLLNGAVRYPKDNIMLHAGDSITCKDLIVTEVFEIVEDTLMLIITQKKFFEWQTKYAEELSEIMEAIQNKDHYTEEHCNNTGNLALRIAVKMGLKNQEVNDVIRASKIHDVGKIKVPIEILNKPGRYTQEEYEIMKRHPKDGYDVIVDLVSEREAQIVLQHHEKCDGSGYPNGLVKDEMLLESRILAVADAFDALVSKRPYREGLSCEEAFNIIYSDGKTLWDFDVIMALQSTLIEDGRLEYKG